MKITMESYEQLCAMIRRLNLRQLGLVKELVHKLQIEKIEKAQAIKKEA